jgi:hypothetical protein
MHLEIDDTNRKRLENILLRNFNHELGDFLDQLEYYDKAEIDEGPRTNPAWINAEE